MSANINQSNGNLWNRDMYGLDPKGWQTWIPKCYRLMDWIPSGLILRTWEWILRPFQELILNFWDWILKCFREWIPSSFSLWGLIWRHLEWTPKHLHHLHNPSTLPLFHLSSNFPVSYPSIPPCSSFTTPIFYLNPQPPLFYSPLPNLLPQPLLWLCPPHSGPVTAPMESAASGKICKLRRMHQLLAYHGQVSQASNQRVQQKSDRWWHEEVYHEAKHD